MIYELITKSYSDFELYYFLFSRNGVFFDGEYLIHGFHFGLPCWMRA
jgi:hypothetical protein